MAKQKVSKQILRLGKWLHPSAPGGVLEITKEYLKDIVNNFEHTPYVPVLRGHVDNSVAEGNPDLVVSKNIDGLELKEDGLYAKFELDSEELEKYADVSASIEPRYINHETGEDLGPVLRHVALVLNPFIKGLKTFMPLTEKQLLQIYLSDISNMEDKKVDVQPEVLEVPETSAEATEVEAVVEGEKETEGEQKPEVQGQETTEVVAQDKTQAETPAVEEKSEESPTSESEDKPAEDTQEPVNASDYQKRIQELEEKLQKSETLLAEKEADRLFGEFLSQGKVIPSQKQVFVQLCALTKESINLGDNDTKTVKELIVDFVQASPAVIKFGEQGVDLEANISLADEIPAQFLSELRKQRPEMSEDSFADWVEKNRDKIKESLKKYKA